MRELDTFFVKSLKKRNEKTMEEKHREESGIRIGAFTNELFLCQKHTYTLFLSASNIFLQNPMYTDGCERSVVERNRIPGVFIAYIQTEFYVRVYV